MRSSLILILLAGCAIEGDELGTDESNLNGRTIYDSSSDNYVEPFTAAVLERMTFLARTVGATTAFERCVVNTMRARYMNCGDTFESSNPENEIAEAWTRFRTWNNHMLYRNPAVSLPGAGASAPGGQAGDPYGTHLIDFYESFTRGRDWTDDTVNEWPHFTRLLIHEYMHTLGYGHLVPRGGAETPVATACALQNGKSSYFEDGDPSAVHIYEDCALAVLEQSEGRCNATPICASNQVRVVSGWTGTNATSQPTGDCMCASDPRHVFALSTSTGDMVTAMSGGGGAISTNWSNSIGAWQWFYGYDRNGASWASADSTWVKSFSGPYLRRGSDGVFRADSTAPWGTRMDLVSGTQLGNGATVTLRQGTSYAYSDGSTLRSTTSSTDSRARFVVHEPRRDHLVYLRTAHDRFVSADLANPRYVWNQLDGGDLETGSEAVRASAAFWIVDWNGGELQDGDVISLEQFAASSYHYLSAGDGGHTGHVRMVNGVNTHERWVIRRVGSGTGPITHETQISLQSAHGTYLTATSSTYFPYEVRNYGTFVGAWQRFELRFVFHHDQDRYWTCCGTP
jgi:hypothetical protein